MRRALTGTMVCILLAAALASPALGAGGAGGRIPTDGKPVADGINEFALDLYAQLRSEPGNLFFSPYSISTALTMTYAGAGGETARQMREVLGFRLKDDRLHAGCANLSASLEADRKTAGYELTIANALWGQRGYGFQSGFLGLNRKHYGAGLKIVDFARNAEGARKEINGWVERKTRDRIKDLIPAGVLSPLTRLVLTNAIYFKGDWAAKFKESRTKDGIFHVSAAEKVTVPMMKQTEKFGYHQGRGFQALELPYKGDALSMVIFLPETVDGLAGIEKILTAKKIAEVTGRLHRQKVRVEMPRFKMTLFVSLKEALVAMGMADAFSDRRADFSGMTGGRDLYISHVLHKAFVEVNEEGTEAAAATAVVMALRGMPAPPPLFRADRPFVFIIRDRGTGAILFMGRVANPKA